MTGIQETGRRNEDEVNLPSTSKQPLNTKRRQAGEHERLEKANSKRKCQPKSSITDDKLIEIISNKEDADEQFMLSCVPFLKQLTPQNNLMARIHIQNLLYKLAYENNHNYHTRLSTSMSTTTPIPQPSPGFLSSSTTDHSRNSFTSLNYETGNSNAQFCEDTSTSFFNM